MKMAVPILLGLLSAAAVFYFGFAAWLRVDGRFAFHTTLNGHDVSLQRALEVQDFCMSDYYPNMSFTIEGRDGLSYRVTPATFDFTGAERAVSFLPERTLLWAGTLFGKSSFTTRDGDALSKLVRRVESESGAFRDGSYLEPQDAYIEYSKTSGTFQIVADSPGASIDLDSFEAALKRHVLYGSGNLDLESESVYRSAAIRSTSPELVDACDRLNRFLASEVVFAENGASLTFPVRSLLPYLKVTNEPLTIVYDSRSAAEDGVFDALLTELSEAFDSTGVERSFLTHDGMLVTVKEKTWIAKLDAAATVDALAHMSFDELSVGGRIEGKLVWERAALDQLSNYVEVDLTNQTLYLYTDGRLVLETPVVSGCVAQRHTTPAGAFSLAGKYRNVTLRGPGYASFVRYWMPFNNKIGLHDASWRSRFGGTIYQTNGSHGCVNLPRDMAETIFNTIDDSYAIVCYWRPVAETPVTTTP
jgi:hypothetical protein